MKGPIQEPRPRLCGLACPAACGLSHHQVLVLSAEGFPGPEWQGVDNGAFWLCRWKGRAWPRGSCQPTLGPCVLGALRGGGRPVQDGGCGRAPGPSLCSLVLKKGLPQQIAMKPAPPTLGPLWVPRSQHLVQGTWAIGSSLWASQGRRTPGGHWSPGASTATGLAVASAPGPDASLLGWGDQGLGERSGATPSGSGSGV